MHVHTHPHAHTHPYLHPRGVWARVGAVLCILPLAAAEIYTYKGYLVKTAAPVYREVAQYAASDAPAKFAPGRGRSYVDLASLSLSLQCDGTPQPTDMCKNVSEFDMLWFRKPTPDDSWLNYWPDNEYCCSDGKADCTVGSVILPQQLQDAHIIRFPVTREPIKIEGSGSQGHLMIKTSGLYILMMAFCEPSVYATRLDGAIEAMNPYGYLPGDKFGCLIFFGVVAAVYLCLGLAWFVMCAMFSTELMAVQLWITLVVFMGMFETSTTYFDYLTWNSNGTRSTSLMILGVLAGVLKRALSRVCVLMVSLGYGVVKPSLGPELKRVLLLGSCYMVLGLVYSLLLNLPSSTKYAESEQFASVMSSLTLLIATCDTLVYAWVLHSLTVVIQQLEARKQLVKLSLYRWFRSVCVVSLVFAAFWALYCIYEFSGTRYDRMWPQRWTIDAVWEVCYVLVLTAMVVLWAPCNNSQRFAYSSIYSSIEMAASDNDDQFVDPDDGEYGGQVEDDELYAARPHISREVAVASDKMK